MGIASRARARQMIADGRVQVDAKICRSPDAWVDPRTVRITIDGVSLRKKGGFVYLALNKPAGIVTTRSDERGRKTVYDTLPPGIPWLFPVGRLDKDTSGLLIFTNDSRFGNILTSPASGIPKTYRVRLDSPLSDNQKRLIESGMTLRDGVQVLPAHVRRLSQEFEYELTISEGKNRQVRRMFETTGHVVLALQRIRIGPIVLGELPPGRTRPLTDPEIEGIKFRGGHK